jgi:hypothetical protein
MDYKVVHIEQNISFGAAIQKIEKEVNALLAKGWSLKGDFEIVSRHDSLYFVAYQPLIKANDDIPASNPVEYKIVYVEQNISFGAAIPKAEKEINNLITKGWTLRGDFKITPRTTSNYFVVYQVLVKTNYNEE